MKLSFGSIKVKIYDFSRSLSEPTVDIGVLENQGSVNRGLPIDTIVHNVVAALQNLDKRWEEVLTFPATIRFYT